jgi:hypothetical protein
MIVSVFVCALAGSQVSSALAAPGDGLGQGSGGSVGGVVTAGVTYRTTGGSNGGAGGCTWQASDESLTVDGVGTVSWPRTVGGTTYDLWKRTCPTGVTFVEVPRVGPADILPGLLDQLRSQALPKPTPVFESLDAQFDWAYVRTPMDFRAGSDSWRAVSVTASVGPVWARVTARPISVTHDEPVEWPSDHSLVWPPVVSALLVTSAHSRWPRWSPHASRSATIRCQTIFISG